MHSNPPSALRRKGCFLFFFGTAACLADSAMTFQQQPDSLNGQFFFFRTTMTPGVHFKLKLTHAASVWCCVWNPLPDSSVSSLSPPSSPALTPPTPDSVSPPRWFISPGCVLSTSRPPKGSAVSESPVLSIAWRCSSGAPSSCRTMTISFKVAAPVLYAQVQNKTHKHTKNCHCSSCCCLCLLCLVLPSQ